MREIINYKKLAAFRPWLLNLHSRIKQQGQRPEEVVLSASDITDWVCTTADLPKSWVNGTIGLVPLHLSCWTLNSRRIYEISGELQTLLMATSLKEVRWSDVDWPFLSFAMSLEQPMRSLPDDLGSDFLIVYQCSLPQSWMKYGRREGVPDNYEEPVFMAEGFNSSRLNEYQPLTQAQKDDLTRRLGHARTRRSTLRQLEADWKSLDEANLRGFEGMSGFMVPLNRDTLIPESVAKSMDERRKEGLPDHLSAQQLAFYERLTRLVAGFPLYLKSLPAKSPCLSPPQPICAAGPDPSAIVREADLCTVSSKFRVSREEQVLLGIIPGEPGERERYALSCHFREAYWRRFPGQGKNPNAPKAVHVRSTIVRRDRLPDGGTPGGSVKNMEP
jgi:hypothetical protein